jgi:hypothetical protein
VRAQAAVAGGASVNGGMDMRRLAWAAVAAIAWCVPAPAQVASAAGDASVADGCVVLEPGQSMRTRNGDECVHNEGRGNLKVRFMGRMTRDPRSGDLLVDDITAVGDSGDGGIELTVEGAIEVVVTRTSARVTTRGDRTSVRVSGDQVIVNANGTNALIRQDRGALGLTVNAAPASSGAITFPTSWGFRGTFNPLGPCRWYLLPRD